MEGPVCHHAAFATGAAATRASTQAMNARRTGWTL